MTAKADGADARLLTPARERDVITQVNFEGRGVYAGGGTSSLLQMASEKDGWVFEDRGEWVRFWNKAAIDNVYEVPRERVTLRKVRVGK